MEALTGNGGGFLYLKQGENLWIIKCDRHSLPTMVVRQPMLDE